MRYYTIPAGFFKYILLKNIKKSYFFFLKKINMQSILYKIKKIFYK